MPERLPNFGESPYYNILVPWLRVSHAADGTLFGGGSGLNLNYNTADTISGQSNLIGQKITVTPTGSVQQLGVWIDMTTTNVLGTGGLFRIPLAVRVQSGGGTGAGTGEGMRGLNLIVQQNAADTQATMALVEGTVNNNKADVGANPPSSTAIIGYSAASLGLHPGTNAFSADGSGQWWRGYRVAQGAIVVGGNAFEYAGDGTHGGFTVNDAARVTMGNSSTVAPTLTIGNGLLVNSGILLVGTTVTTSAASGYVVVANNKALSSVDAAGTGTRELIRLTGSNVIHINPSADSVIAMGVPASVSGAATGDHVMQNTKALRSANAAGSSTLVVVDLNASNVVRIAPDGGDILWGRALVANGGGATPTFGTIGGSGPAAAAQRGWLRVIESDGTASFLPLFR